MSEASAAVGQQLRAERERKGLSAQRAADELHLDGWVIDALESGDYERLGPAVYAKGHLKRYASLLGLPVEQVLEGFSPVAGPAETPRPATMRMRTAAPAGSELPWVPIVSFAAVAAAIIGILLWRPWHARSATAPVAASAAVELAASAAAAADTGAMPDARDAEPAPGAAVPVPGGSSALPGSGAAGPAAAHAPPANAGPAAAAAATATAKSTTATAATAAGQAKLRLSFSADSWVDIHDATGVRVYAGTGHANTVRTISGAAPLRVYLKSASGVQLQVNNRAVAIGPQYLAGSAAHFEAGADGVLRRDPQTPAASAAPAHGAPAHNARPRG